MGIAWTYHTALQARNFSFAKKVIIFGEKYAMTARKLVCNMRMIIALIIIIVPFNAGDNNPLAKRQNHQIEFNNAKRTLFYFS